MRAMDRKNKIKLNYFNKNEIFFQRIKKNLRKNAKDNSGWSED